MKKMKLTLGLFLIMVAVACGQKPENNFTVPIYFPAGIYIGTDTNLHTTWPTGGGGTADWNTLLNKPATFPSTWATVSGKPTFFDGTWTSLTGKPTTFAPAAHNHDLLYRAITWKPDYNTDILNLPGSIELQAAISQMQGFMLPKLTTVQINALTPVEGLEVYDLTLHVKKYWNGSTWKIMATTN